MWSSVFYVRPNPFPGLSCLEWVNTGVPIFGDGVEFVVGPATVYWESGGGVLGKVRAKCRCSRQVAEHAKSEACKNGGGGSGYCGGNGGAGLSA